ncbi:TetR/AcrR family transcriptional regulator [Cellulomonas sp. PhB143]|uniref:TetR/AcrR family transcriptional regulator n=1 Tax=Cellulomonas sp. PhB143 TaxID=2485186 RepID=UPI000F46327B|nr:TetR/AcrR family transcriptional regulator [Cellulomonas sp. PhB143]ROS75385.1 TetR family transcriptional regulator [Cellulomonas sp. PhB143]
MSDADVTGTRAGVRAQIVEAAARLLREHGAAAVTTRGVAQAARVQAPTIYRLFGDKDGLLDAVAEHVMATHVAAKAASVAATGGAPQDLLADLREAWQVNQDFGLANPELYVLLNAPGRARPSPATEAGIDVLRARVRRLAAAGMLRVGERRALEMIHAAGSGVVLTLLGQPPGDRDLALADAMFDAVARAVLVDVPQAPGEHDGDAVTSAAVALGAVVPRLPGLTGAERGLMAEWVDRAVTGLQDAGPRP